MSEHTHHHHVEDGSVVFHSHDELSDPHLLLLVSRIEDGDEFRFINDLSERPEECRDRTCSMRRHDDG